MTRARVFYHVFARACDHHHVLSFCRVCFIGFVILFIHASPLARVCYGIMAIGGYQVTASARSTCDTSTKLV